MTTIDLCIKSNHVLNVFSRLFEPNVLWINDGQIIATGESSAFHARRTLIMLTNTSFPDLSTLTFTLKVPF